MNLSKKPYEFPLWRCLLAVVACSLMVIMLGFETVYALDTHSHYEAHVMTDFNDNNSINEQPIILVSKYERTGEIYFVTGNTKCSIYCLSLNGTVNLIGKVYGVISAIEVNQTNGDIFLGVGGTVRRLVDVKTTEIIAGYERSTTEYIPNPTSPVIATSFSFVSVQDILVVDSDIYVLNTHSLYKVSNGMLSTKRGDIGYTLKGICKSVNTSNFYVTDFTSARLQQFNPQSMKITVIAGQNGKMESKGDGGLAIDSSLNGPIDCAVTNEEEIFITQDDYRIRKISSNNTIITVYKGVYMDTFISKDGTILLAEWKTISVLNLNGTVSTLLDISKSPYSNPYTLSQFQLSNNTIIMAGLNIWDPPSNRVYFVSIIDGTILLPNIRATQLTLSEQFLYFSDGNSKSITKYSLDSNQPISTISTSPYYPGTAVVSSLSSDIYFIIRYYTAIFKIEKGLGSPVLFSGSLTESGFKGENGSLASEALFSNNIKLLYVASIVQENGSMIDELYVVDNNRIRVIRNNRISLSHTRLPRWLRNTWQPNDRWKQ